MVGGTNWSRSMSHKNRTGFKYPRTAVWPDIRSFLLALSHLDLGLDNLVQWFKGLFSTAGENPGLA